ncbi:MAG: DNA primase [Dehalococcoidia bacterium]
MSTVDEVKARLDIVEVVGGYVRLQKAGRYFKGLCPFHTEKTPSFVVYADRQSWHCFGACGTGGDVISFVSKKENLDFSSALRLLAERAGVEMRSDGKRREEIRTLQDANEAAAVYFHSLLGGASNARSYIEERGLNDEAVNDFMLGYAPSGWETLRTHLNSKGFKDEMLIESGLLIESERGGYDRFRNRLMFPIRDDRGRVVGFGGRILPDTNMGTNDNAPKYMNTPQSPIFDKGGLLYALDRARESMRQSGTAVIVEGYMDVIAAHQYGFRNVVASMGTALTDRQATLLQRQASRVVLAMDSDEAGSAANLRGVQVVAAATARGTSQTRKQPLDIRVLALPQGKDPDELIRADPGAWPRAVETAKPVVDHLLAVTSAGLDLSQPLARSQLVNEVLPVIAEVEDPVLQAHYLQRLSRLSRTSEESLRREMPRRARAQRRETMREAEGLAPEAASLRPAQRLREKREEYLLAMLYRMPEISHLGAEVDSELFSLSENRELFRRWLDAEPTTEESDEDNGLFAHYMEVLDTRLVVTETAQVEAAFLSCVAFLEKARMRAVKEASALALAEGEAGVRPGQVATIALAKYEAGSTEDASEDDELEAVASLLLRDTIASLNLHRRDDQTSADPDHSGLRSSRQNP